MSQFCWGIIGTGYIAKAFAEDIKFLSGHCVGAVGSRSEENARTFSQTFGGVGYSSYEALVNDPKVHAVYVATPHTSHKENVLLALKAGKPVLCEKPFAVNVEQVIEMIQVAKENGVALMEAMWSRFLPHYGQVRQIVESGILGPIRMIQADHGQRLADQKINRLVDPNLAGGALLDLGIYPVSFAHMILGKPNKITASGVLTDEGVDARTSIILDYDNGAQAILNTTMIEQTPTRAVVAGLNGWLDIDRTFYTPADMKISLYDGTVTNIPNKYLGHGLREQAEIFRLLVESEKLESEILNWQSTLEIMQILDTVRNQISLKYPFES